MMKREEIKLALIASFALLVASCTEPAVSGMTEGRSRALIGAALGLLGVITAVIALIRASRTAAIIGLVLGAIGAILSVIHLAGSGGFGTGGGRAGAIVGLILGFAGMILGGVVIGRSRRG